MLNIGAFLIHCGSFEWEMFPYSAVFCLVIAKKVKKRRKIWKYQEETGLSFLYETRKRLYDKYVGGEDGAEGNIRDELEIL